jgi:hypothetical protein
LRSSSLAPFSRSIASAKAQHTRLGEEIFKLTLTDLHNQLHALLDWLKLLHLFAQVPK